MEISKMENITCRLVNGKLVFSGDIDYVLETEIPDTPEGIVKEAETIARILSSKSFGGWSTGVLTPMCAKFRQLENALGGDREKLEKLSAIKNTKYQQPNILEGKAGRIPFLMGEQR